MMFLSKKKREWLEWLLGGAFYYAFARNEDSTDAMDLFVELCDELGLNYEAVVKNEQTYGIARAYQAGDL